MVSPTSLIPLLPAVDVANPNAFFLLLLIPVALLIARFSRRGMRPERFRASVAIRVLLLIVLVLTAADLRIRVAADRLSVAFLVDVSDSVPPAARDDAIAFIRSALEAAPSGDEAAIVAFANDAYVERNNSPNRTVQPFTSNPTRNATDIAAALRVGLGVLPTDRARRLVLLSDGNENREHAREEARVMAAAGVPVDYVALGETREPEVVLRGFEAPTAIRDGDTFNLRLSIESTVETTARILLLTDGRLGTAATVGQLGAPIQLIPGSNNIVLPHDPLPPGFHTFRLQIEPAIDTIPENNESVAFTTVSGKPRVLLVEGARGEARFIADALQAGGIETQVVVSTALPSDPAAMRAWDGIVLVNQPASLLAVAQMRALKTYVQTLGGGLTIVGGDRSFVLGSYQRTPLEELSPVSMQRRGARAQSSVALALVIDASGSMNESVAGVSKMDLAKESAMAAIDLLTPSDQVGVLGFDDASRWISPIATLNDPEAVRGQIRRLAPGGGTAIYPALEQAFNSIEGTEAKIKHLVLATDGISPTGDYAGLTRRMRDANVTLSTIGIGNDADLNFLRQLAEQGNGRFYDGSDPRQVPQIFIKETLEIARTAIVEEPFQPVPVGTSPILDGIQGNQLPITKGYVALTAKPAALVVLGTRQGDPLLTEWQYGLGQVVAWTSDSVNRWSSEWIEWSEYSRFWSQVVKRTIPAQIDQNLQTTVSIDGDRARIAVETLGDDRSFRNFLRTSATMIAPDGKQSELKFDQVGPGRYESISAIGPAGAYLLQVSQREANDEKIIATQPTGFVTTSATEYWQLRPNRLLLDGLTRATSGRVLTNPADAFSHNLRSPGTGRELWPFLTMMAIMLFLLDVAVRRLRIPVAAAVNRATEWAQARLGRRVAVRTIRPSMARLLVERRQPRANGAMSTAGSTSVATRLAASRAAIDASKLSARAASPAPVRPTARVVVSAGATSTMTKPASAPKPKAPPSSSSSPSAPASGSTASRLLAAKQRARETKR